MEGRRYKAVRNELFHPEMGTYSTYGIVYGEMERTVQDVTLDEGIANWIANTLEDMWLNPAYMEMVVGFLLEESFCQISVSVK